MANGTLQAARTPNELNTFHLGDPANKYSGLESTGESLGSIEKSVLRFGSASGKRPKRYSREPKTFAGTRSPVSFTVGEDQNVYFSISTRSAIFTRHCT